MTFTSPRLRRLAIGLILLAASTASSIAQQATTPKPSPAPKGSPRAVISAKPSDANRQGLLIRFEDTRSGGTVFVRQSVQSSDAAQWLAEVNKAEDAPSLVAIVQANLPKGLVGAKRPLQGIEYLAAPAGIDLSGPGRPGTIGVSLRNIRMGHGVYYVGDAPQATIEGFLKAAGDAKSVEELATLVTLNHASGLLAAFQYQDLGDSRVTAEAFWSMRAK